MKKITQNIKVIILGLILTVGMGYAVAATFTGPTCGPEGDCNTPAPVNVGGNDVGKTPYSQLKTGLLTLMSVITPDLTVRNADSSPVMPGQVLTAIDSNGKVGWGSISSPMLGIGSDVITDPGVTNTTEVTRQVDVPSGATFAKITAVGTGNCTTSSGQSASQVCVEYSPGGLAQKTISLEGIDFISVTMKTRWPGVITNADVTFGSPIQKISTYSTVSAGGGRTNYTNVATGGDINGFGPYLGYGASEPNSRGLVLIEWY